MVIAILIIAGVGLVAAVALAVADRYLSVQEDPRIGMVIVYVIYQHLLQD